MRVTDANVPLQTGFARESKKRHQQQRGIRRRLTRSAVSSSVVSALMAAVVVTNGLDGCRHLPKLVVALMAARVKRRWIPLYPPCLGYTMWMICGCS
eukprot:5495039-Pyramimonas_sp.AAC.1